jgi:large conductance mechanosensitive channel
MSKNEPSYAELLEEVKKIRELVTPPPPEPEEPKEEDKSFKARIKRFGQDFLDFLKKNKIIGLAVAFIMAVYVGALVNSVVNDLIFALLEDIPGFDTILATDPNASWMDWPFGSSIRLGAFFSNVITFVIVAFVVFLIVKLAKRIGLE